MLEGGVGEWSKGAKAPTHPTLRSPHLPARRGQTSGRVLSRTTWSECCTLSTITMLSNLRVARTLQTPTRALSARRQLHLQQAVAFRLLESQGLPVAPFELLTSASDAAQALKALGSEQVQVRAQLTDAAGVGALRDGKFGSLQGISFKAET